LRQDVAPRPPDDRFFFMAATNYDSCRAKPASNFGEEWSNRHDMVNDDIRA